MAMMTKTTAMMTMTMAMMLIITMMISCQVRGSCGWCCRLPGDRPPQVNNLFVTITIVVVLIIMMMKITLSIIITTHTDIKA